MSKVEEAVKALAEWGANAPEPPMLVIEIPLHLNPEGRTDLRDVATAATFKKIGMALFQAADAITLRIGGQEMVLKDRHGDREDTLDSSDSSTAR